MLQIIFLPKFLNLKFLCIKKLNIKHFIKYICIYIKYYKINYFNEHFDILLCSCRNICYIFIIYTYFENKT